MVAGKETGSECGGMETERPGRGNVGMKTNSEVIGTDTSIDSWGGGGDGGR